MGTFDDIMKVFVGENPQALVSFLLAGAIYTGNFDRELKTRTINADLLYHVIWNDEPIILHVEFQRYRDSNMPRRVWEYNALTSILTGKPVYSVVIYLLQEPSITEPMYHLSFRNGHVVQWFVFHQIKLWELAPEVFEQPQLTGLLPLLPLTKNGQNRDTVDRMINALYQSGQQDLLWLGQAIAGFVFTSAEDKQWLKERFHTMFDILKGSWVYQETIEEGKQEGIRQGIKEGIEKGLKEGVEKGLTQGKQEGLTQGVEKGVTQDREQVILRLIELRHPSLLTLAKQVIERKLSFQQLQALSDKLFLVSTLAEAQAALQAYDTEP